MSSPKEPLIQKAIPVKPPTLHKRKQAQAGSRKQGLLPAPSSNEHRDGTEADVFFSTAMLVFVAEMCVVTIGTIRIIFVSRGMKFLAPILGFFEIMTWLFAISQIMQNLSDVSCFMAFAGGFTLGNFLGILIEEKLAMGTALVRIITTKDAEELARNLTQANFGVTCLQGHGTMGPVRVLLTVVKRKEIDKVTALIKEFDPKVFFSVNEVQTVNEGVFPLPRVRPSLLPNPFKILRHRVGLRLGDQETSEVFKTSEV